jgi:hypothetical protein
MGNSQLVAAKHYLQITDDHFRLATAPSAAIQDTGQRIDVNFAEENRGELKRV